ncbi:hypothetical protein [Bradyrhizobium erythrophlei]|uniref:Uncharacterized protein n=1 Tax=Bradyrhizobium erythrophlei TaxID=1437360 RepID=A0A1H4P2X0_9BRAD|nr:hypothetical protein [Bradyrhizobium erythrophlei]SEC01498.1 hypothetical protein SAMN05444164_0802 [Bradyrhizobium erythrophlei]
MKNLARSNPSPEEIDAVTAVCRSELEAAGIKPFESTVFLGGEVPSRAIGELASWGFRRAWYYWVAEGPGIPPHIAEELHAKHGNDVRVDGHCGCPSPREWHKGFAVGRYHVDTQEGLNALADTIRSVAVAASQDAKAPTAREQIPGPEKYRTPAIDQRCIVGADLERLRTAANEACDLLAERTYGSPARSPGHNARLLPERTLKTIPVPPEGQTPAARWREAGEPDPHGVRYDCDRAQLAGGDLTDDEAANAVFLDPSINNLTIAKERFRWLSRRLETADAGLAKVKQIIEDVDNRALAADGPVTPTLQEMTDEEMRKIFALASRKPEDWRPCP